MQFKKLPGLPDIVRQVLELIRIKFSDCDPEIQNHHARHEEGGTDPVNISLTSGVSGLLPVVNGGTGTNNGSITGTGSLTFTPGGANGSLTVSLPGTGKMTVSNSDNAIPFVVARVIDDNQPLNVIDIQHLGTVAPSFGFGARIVINLLGYSLSPVNCASYGAYWETDQVNDTTARKSTLLMRNMSSNVLQTALQITSALDLSGPATFTIGANTLGAGEWAALDEIDASWAAWTPTWTNLTVGTGGTNQGYWKAYGKLIVGRVYVKLGSSGFSVGAATMAFPVTLQTYGANTPIGLVQINDASPVQPYLGIILSTGAIRIQTVSGSNIVPTAVSSTVPITWAANDTIQIQFTGEAA